MWSSNRGPTKALAPHFVFELNTTEYMYNFHHICFNFPITLPVYLNQTLCDSLMFTTFWIYVKLQHMQHPVPSNHLIKQQPTNYTDICPSQSEPYITVGCGRIQHTLLYSLNGNISVPVICSSQLPIDVFKNRVLQACLSEIDVWVESNVYGFYIALNVPLTRRGITYFQLNTESKASLKITTFQDNSGNQWMLNLDIIIFKTMFHS